MSTLEPILKKDHEELLRELGITGLSPQEKIEVGDAMIDHFIKVIIETAALQMDDEQLSLFRDALTSDATEEIVAEITAHIPGLAEKLEEVIGEEIALLKATGVGA